jgi:hypothetical protein
MPRKKIPSLRPRLWNQIFLIKQIWKKAFRIADVKNDVKNVIKTLLKRRYKRHCAIIKNDNNFVDKKVNDETKINCVCQWERVSSSWRKRI